MKLPRKPLEAARSRWEALKASTPWARLRALEERLEKLSKSPYQWEERLEDLGRELTWVKAAIESVDLDGLERLDPDDLDGLPSRVEELEGEVLTLKDSMPNEDSMHDAASEAVADLARALRRACDEVS